jgi:hypothetical protein
LERTGLTVIVHRIIRTFLRTLFCSIPAIASHIYLSNLLTGRGYFEIMPSHLPYLRQLNLEQCNNVRLRSLAELVAAAPELEVIDYYGDRVGTVNESESSSSSNTEDIESADEEGH